MYMYDYEYMDYMNIFRSNIFVDLQSRKFDISQET